MTSSLGYAVAGRSARSPAGLPGAGGSLVAVRPLFEFFVLPGHDAAVALPLWPGTSAAAITFTSTANLRAHAAGGAGA